MVNYGIRNWDADTGLPKKQRLEALRMPDVAEQLEKNDLLSRSY
jgi:hypothetical protein